MPKYLQYDFFFIQQAYIGLLNMLKFQSVTFFLNSKTVRASQEAAMSIQMMSPSGHVLAVYGTMVAGSWVYSLTLSHPRCTFVLSPPQSRCRIILSL